MLLRQLFDKESSTYTYLFADEVTQEAAIIDPVMGNIQHYIQLLKELNLKLVLALDTHVHADHITALGSLRDLTACRSMVGSKGDISCASGGLSDGLLLNVGNLSLKAIFTPGHTSDSYCFYVKTNEKSYLFSGDTVLIRGTGRTDFQNGDAGMLFDSIHNKILTLPAETAVLPGHDYKGWTSSTIAEEKAHNPRLLVQSKNDFITLMNNLNLPNPKMMDVAVPANLQCGKMKD